jgi:cytochrome d ubiquinol oxidase subunit I
MNDIFFARAQMGLSLAFHIVFAVIGMAMPVMMTIAELLWRRSGDRDYLELAKRWSKGTAVLFAVGAVSGTVLSFELGLLFPNFMKHAGPVIGMPFSLEGFAFFTEAIFLGIYLYGWQRVSARLHIVAGVIVSLSGFASAAFVLTANAWMNAPRGFRIEHGAFADIDPLAAMTTPFALHEILHMTVAAYMSVGFAVAGVHALAFLRGRGSEFHRKALAIALWLAIPFTLIQPLVGDFAGKQVAKHQPLKLAAMEQLQKTMHRAPITLGPIEIPGALSFAAYSDLDAEVKGLEEWPESDRPPALVKPAFQAMVGLGMFMAAVAALAIVMRIRKREWSANRLFLSLTVAAAPMGFLAIEAGWIVTEVGRQPWVIYGVMRTAQSVTPMPGLVVPFTLFMLVYLLLTVTVVAILRSQIAATFVEHEAETA